MGSVKNRVCMLSSQEVANYLTTYERPHCRDHEHISKQDALELTRELLYVQTLSDGTLRPHYEYNWVRVVVDGEVLHPNYQAITCVDRRRWVIRKSAGFDVHQLVRY